MEGGHRCFDPRFGDSFGTEFDFSDQPGTVDEALRWKFLGTSQPTEGRHDWKSWVRFLSFELCRSWNIILRIRL